MSKRIPVYLSKEELKELISGLNVGLSEGQLNEEEALKLITKLEEQLRTFEET